MKRLVPLAAMLVLLVGCAGETDPPTAVEETSATLHGKVSCVAGDTGTWWFEVATQFGSFARVGPASGYNCGQAAGPAPVQVAATGLVADTAYRYRIVADPGAPGGGVVWVDSTGRLVGTAYDTFRTKPKPTEPPPPPPPGTVLLSPGGNLQSAYDSVAPGGTIQLAAGSWGNVQTPVGTKAVTFSAVSGAVFGDVSMRSSNATWTGGVARELGITGTTNATVQNVDVDAGGAQLVALYMANTTNTTVRDSRVGNVTNEKGGLFDIRNDGVLLERVTFHDVRVTDANVHNECLFVNHTRALTIKDSRFERCATMDVFFTQSGAGQVAENFTLTNNFFGKTFRADGGVHAYSLGFHSALGSIRNLTARSNVFELPINRNGMSGTGVESCNQPPTGIPGIVVESCPTDPPPPPPSGCPTGSRVATGGSLASEVSATPSGGTLCLNGGTWQLGSTVTLGKPMRLMGVNGARLTQTGSFFMLQITSGVTVEGLTMTGLNRNRTGEACNGTGMVRSWAVTDVVVRNLTANNFTCGVQLNGAVRFRMENINLRDVTYSGLSTFPGTDGVVTGNRVENVAVGAPLGQNAYGITFSGTSPTNSRRIQVTDNVVWNAPTWECFDSHWGTQIDFLRNTCYRPGRAGFNIITGQGITATSRVENNTIDATGMTSTAVGNIWNSIAHTGTGTIIGNRVVGFGSNCPRIHGPATTMHSNTCG